MVYKIWEQVTSTSHAVAQEPGGHGQIFLGCPLERNDEVLSRWVTSFG